MIEFAKPNEVVEKEKETKNNQILPVINPVEPTFHEHDYFPSNDDQQTQIKESVFINNSKDDISVKTANVEESNKIIQPFDNEVFETTDSAFNNKIDDLENQLHLSPIKKNNLITTTKLINQLMKSPVPLNVLEEQTVANQLIKISPAALNGFQSPLSRIMVNNYEESSSFNCIDDVVLAAFINDFSYELVENQSFNQNR
jgi:hypothetical protein